MKHLDITIWRDADDPHISARIEDHRHQREIWGGLFSRDMADAREEVELLLDVGPVDWRRDQVHQDEAVALVGDDLDIRELPLGEHDPHQRVGIPADVRASALGRLHHTSTYIHRRAL